MEQCAFCSLRAKSVVEVPAPVWLCCYLLSIGGYMKRRAKCPYHFDGYLFVLKPMYLFKQRSKSNLSSPATPTEVSLPSKPMFVTAPESKAQSCACPSPSIPRPLNEKVFLKLYPHCERSGHRRACFCPTAVFFSPYCMNKNYSYLSVKQETSRSFLLNLYFSIQRLDRTILHWVSYFEPVI